MSGFSRVKRNAEGIPHHAFLKYNIHKLIIIYWTSLTQI